MELERSWWDMFSADEIMVAETLATLLPLPVTNSSKCFGLFSFTWGRKKRRSAISVPVSWPRHTVPYPPPLKPDEASSPATPLSFSPASESDDKDNPTPLPSNSSLKRRREHYLKIMQDLKKDNELITGEIKNVECYYDRLKNFNFSLKARKRELMDDLNQRATPTPPSEGGVALQTTSLGVAPSSGSGRATSIENRNNNNVVPSPSPTGIPDLNLPFEVEKDELMAVLECGEAMDNMDVNRASTAQARHNSAEIYSYSCR